MDLHINRAHGLSASPNAVDIHASYIIREKPQAGSCFLCSVGERMNNRMHYYSAVFIFR